MRRWMVKLGRGGWERGRRNAGSVGTVYCTVTSAPSGVSFLPSSLSRHSSAGSLLEEEESVLLVLGRRPGTRRGIVAGMWGVGKVGKRGRGCWGRGRRCWGKGRGCEGEEGCVVVVAVTKTVGQALLINGAKPM